MEKSFPNLIGGFTVVLQELLYLLTYIRLILQGRATMYTPTPTFLSRKQFSEASLEFR